MGGIDITAIPPEQIFNCDETGFLLSAQENVVLSESYNKNPHRIGGNTKNSLTVLACGSAAGQLMPPTI